MSTTAIVCTESDWPDLIAAARDGDDQALGTISRELYSYLLAVADHNLGASLRPKFGASDIVQQSFIEAQQSFATFNGSSEGEIRAWLKRIVLHNLIDSARKFTDTHARDADREVYVDGGETGWSDLVCQKSKTASWLISNSEIDSELMAAVQTLPARQKHVVEQRHRFGQSYQQIASQLGVTEGAARNLWTRAMENLREILDEENGQLKRRTKPSPR